MGCQKFLTRSRRTNAERSEETRAALMAAARELFVERGYADASTEAIVERARVTRGALYYHFKDKAGLFRAVHRKTDESLIETIAQIMEKAEGDVWQRAMRGSRAFLTLCSTPDIRRILYIDGPVVLAADPPVPVGLGLIQQQTQLLMHLGYIAEQPVEPLSQLIFGSFIQGALYIARADDKDTAQEEIEHSLLKWLNGLRIKP